MKVKPLNTRTWRIIDECGNDVGRVRRSDGGAWYVRCSKGKRGRWLCRPNLGDVMDAVYRGLGRVQS